MGNLLNQLLNNVTYVNLIHDFPKNNYLLYLLVVNNIIHVKQDGIQDEEETYSPHCMVNSK